MNARDLFFGFQSCSTEGSFGLKEDGFSDSLTVDITSGHEVTRRRQNRQQHYNF